MNKFLNSFEPVSFQLHEFIHEQNVHVKRLFPESFSSNMLNNEKFSVEFLLSEIDTPQCLNF